jgi:hypothetical protein
MAGTVEDAAPGGAPDIGQGRGGALTFRIAAEIHGADLSQDLSDDGLNGTAVFENSKVWQLLNVSDRDRFRVVLDNCVLFGAVNIEVTLNAGPLADFAEDGLGDPRDPAMAGGSVR